MSAIRTLLFNVTISFIELFNSILYLISFLFLPITKVIVERVLKASDIQVNGKRDWDPQVTDNRFYCLFAKYSYIGIVVGYADGYFECNDFNELMVRVYKNKYYRILCYHPSLYLRSLFERYFFTQNETVLDEETELLDETFETWKADEETMTFSSGYWKNEKNPEKAAEAKLDLIANKLKLKPGMRVLDIGCGDGTLCKHLAQKYDVEVTGVNICKKAVETARRSCKGLRATFEVMDGRKIKGTFDRITCIGMMEQLGLKDYRVLFNAVSRCLADDGIFILEIPTINHTFVPTCDGSTKILINLRCAWCYYIDVVKSIEGLFVIEDSQNLGDHFTQTVKHWSEKLAKQWDFFVDKSGVRFARSMRAGLGNTYGLSSANYLQIHQLVLSKNGLQNVVY